MREVSVRASVAVAGALIGLPLLAAPASAALCPTAAASFYETAFDAPAAGCTVGPMTFSNFHFATTVTGGGFVTLNDVSPTTFTQTINGQLITEYGLTLSLTSFAPAGGSADVLWTYNVQGAPPGIGDAFASVTGGVTGNGQIFLDEILSNGTALHLTTNQLSGTIFFPLTTDTLFISKDQFSLAGDGTVRVSAITNAFSVPGPLAGAGLPGLMAACGALLALARRRRRKMA